MKKFKFSLFVLAALIGLVTLQSCKKEALDPTKSAEFLKLDDGMHKLWADHMVWTYNTVDAFFNNPDALDKNLDRLLQNQKDIGAAIVPYYGQEAGDKLAELLTEHIQLAVPVLSSAKDGNETALNKALDDWYKNAADIAHFLTEANPEHFEKDHMDMMMKMHIDQTTDYSVKLLQKDYNGAIKVFDEAFDHMTEMAHDLSNGIAQQMPEKF